MKPTQEQVIAWAREAGLHIATDVHWMPIIGFEYIEKATTLAYEAGRKDEREHILDMCKEGLWDGEGIRFHLDKRGAQR